MRAAVCAASFSSSTPFYYPPTAKTKPSSPVFLSFVTPFPALPLPSLLFASNSPPRSAYAAKKSPPADTASNKRSVGKRTPDRPPADVDSVGLAPAGPAQLRRDRPPPLPKPPAGFLLDQNGRVINVASKRTATLVDPDNNLPLECVIRRAFQSSKGDECMLLYPLDKPIQILKSANFSGWSAVNDEDVQSLIPAAAYALAKIHMHLVLSGFCYTARGGFCYSEEDVLQFGTDDDQSVEGLPAEGVEITCFNLDLWRSRRCLKKVEGFDHSVVNETLGACGNLPPMLDNPILPYYIWQCGEVEELSGSIPLMEFDFANPIHSCYGKIKIDFSKTGVCHGFALWIDWVMDEKSSIVVSTGPVSRYWKQGVKLLSKAVVVNTVDCSAEIESYFDHSSGEITVSSTFSPSRSGS